MPKKTPSSKNKITSKHYQKQENWFGVCLGGFSVSFKRIFGENFKRETRNMQQVRRTEKEIKHRLTHQHIKKRQNLETENWAQASKPSLKVIQQKKFMNRK